MEAAVSYKRTLFNFMTLSVLTAHVRQPVSNLSNGGGKEFVK